MLRVAPIHLNPRAQCLSTMSNSASKSAPNLPSFPVPAPHQPRNEPSADDLIGPLARIQLAREQQEPWTGGFRAPPQTSPGRNKPLPAPPDAGPSMPQPTFPTSSNPSPFGSSPMPRWSPEEPVYTVKLFIDEEDRKSSSRPPFTGAHSDPAPHQPIGSSVAGPAFPSTPPRRKHSSALSPSPDGLAVPASPRPISQSNPTTPARTTAADVAQCAGITKNDKRCQNKVKVGVPLTYIDGIPEDDIERYCHLHIKVILQPSGFYSRKQKIWLEFSGNHLVVLSRASIHSHNHAASKHPLIPAWLSEPTQALLRIECTKAASPSDEEGYIYTFELRRKSRLLYCRSLLNVLQNRKARTKYVSRRVARRRSRVDSTSGGNNAARRSYPMACGPHLTAATAPRSFLGRFSLGGPHRSWAALSASATWNWQISRTSRRTSQSMSGHAMRRRGAAARTTPSRHAPNLPPPNLPRRPRARRHPASACCVRAAKFTRRYSSSRRRRAARTRTPPASGRSSSSPSSSAGACLSMSTSRCER